MNADPSAAPGRRGLTPMAPHPAHTKSVSLLRQFAQRQRSSISGTSPRPASTRR